MIYIYVCKDIDIISETYSSPCSSMDLRLPWTLFHPIDPIDACRSHRSLRPGAKVRVFKH